MTLDFLPLVFNFLILGFLAIRVLVSLYNLITHPVLPKYAIQQTCTSVSVLIPARNEEKNIGIILQNLIEIERNANLKLEIMVLNDHSTDNTEKIVADFALSNPIIKLLNGMPLPSGWLGKNWACHQLAGEAKGTYFLFVDADVRLENSAVRSSLERMHVLNLDLLSLFPEQLMQSFGERQIVPLMHYLLLSLLPLRLVRTSPFPSLSAANGQFMLFRASTYQHYQFHEQVKNNVLDDVNIMRIAKENALKTEVLLGNGQVFCRMYSSGSEAFKGFSKNLFLGFGKNSWGFQAYFLLIFWLWIPFWYFASWKLLVASVILIIAQRVFIAILANQNIAQNVFFHPLQMILYTFIGINSMYIHVTNQVQWKGRKV